MKRGQNKTLQFSLNTCGITTIKYYHLDEILTKNLSGNKNICEPHFYWKSNQVKKQN